MKKLMMATALAAMAFGTNPVQAADDASSPVAVSSTRAPVLTNELKLLKSRVVSDNITAVVPAGFQFIDPGTTLTCPGNASLGCMITAEQNVQVNGSAANNRYAYCTLVNGVFMNQPNCPFLGHVAPVNVFIASSFEQAHRVNPGTVNTVRTQLFTDFGATRGLYNIHYEIHKILP